MSTMDLLSKRTVDGTFASAGSFRCRNCGYVLTLSGQRRTDRLPELRRHRIRPCIAVQRRSAPAAAEDTARHGGVLTEPAPLDREAQLARRARRSSGPASISASTMEASRRESSR